MADGGLTIDLGSALPWAEDKIRRFFGKDDVTLQRKALLKQLHDTAVEMTSSVQCIGMHRAIPFEKIYQPTKLRVRSGLNISAAAAFGSQNRHAQAIALDRFRALQTTQVSTFLESPENAVIFAGPGWGKTTFLHFIFRRKSSDPNCYTILLTLRRPNAVDHLEEVVSLCIEGVALKRGVKVLLLVDGYDEIQTTDRRKVSDSLLRFSAAKAGRFILTCRDHYAVVGLSAAHVHIDSFDTQDKYRFVTAFLTAFESRLDPIKMVNELEDRELSDFLSHPLLLALACIVKSGRGSEQPRSALRLLERALVTLQYTWDMDKGVDRERLTDLDGGDRMQILKRIAFASRSPFMSGSRAEMITRKALDRLQINRVDPVLVLRESAQFYGILIQSADGWEFVHRSIQDYLAAKFWVESGAFASEKRYEWNTRTAYGACISGNATDVLIGALGSSNGFTCAAETLMNGPDFDMKVVAAGLKAYYSSRGRAVVMDTSPGDMIAGGVEGDLFKFLGNRFLNYLIEEFCKQRSDLTDLLTGYCLAELRRRHLRVDYSTFAAMKAAFPNLRFQFRLADGTFVTPEMAQPVSKP